LKTIELSYLSDPPFTLPEAIAATRLDLLAKATDLNAKAATMRADRRYPRGSSEEAEARQLLGRQVSLRIKIGDYLGNVIACQPAAVADSMGKLDAVRQTVSQSVADALSKSHPGYTPEISNHPAVAEATEAHGQLAKFPAHAWRVANSEEIEQVRRELGRIGG
jgi:hypothetical protein